MVIYLGGDDFDNKLVVYCLNEFKKILQLILKIKEIYLLKIK